jgi:predicted flavoprotein YhiN
VQPAAESSNSCCRHCCCCPQVRDRLVAACQKLGVRFVYNASVEQITPPAGSGADSAAAGSMSAGPWRVGLASGPTVTADRLVVSTGGYSFPAVGTDGTGLRLLTGMGHKLSAGDCYAALTPLKGPHPGGEQLAGEQLSSGLLVLVRLSGSCF